MSPTRPDGPARGVSRGSISRRRLLGVGGLVAAGALSGCLDRVASATVTTGASPAVPFAGVGEYTGPSPSGEPTVRKLTPTVSADVGSVELEAWVTTRAVAANYNNTRSNRSTIRRSGDPDSDGDGVDDTVETHTTALELETRLLSQTTAAADAISKRAARTSRSRLADMEGTIREVRATLERCPDDVCVTVRDHAEERLALTRQASAHVGAGAWTAAAEAVRAVRTIVERDIALLESSVNDTATTETQSPSNARLQELTGANEDDITALYEYLAGEPVISEQFTITVPEARLPGRDLTLVDELTPRRLLEYVTGRVDDEGLVYAWGPSELAGGERGDDSSPIYEGEGTSGESAIYHSGLLSNGDSEEGSPLVRSDTFRSYVSEPVDTGAHLASRVVDGTVVIMPVNDPPRTTAATPAVAVGSDGSTSGPLDLDDWGAEGGASASTATLVCPLFVVPPDCPMPFPALLYVRRCRHADQYIYTGGWLVDDGSLYEDSVTALTVDGPVEVLGVDGGDLDGDGYGDALATRLSGSRRRRGARLFDGTVSDAIEQGVLPDTGDCDDGDCTITPGAAGDDGRDDDRRTVCTATNVSAPVVHFADASASDGVKFKAGAELSKSVN